MSYVVTVRNFPLITIYVIIGLDIDNFHQIFKSQTLVQTFNYDGSELYRIQNQHAIIMVYYTLTTDRRKTITFIIQFSI